MKKIISFSLWGNSTKYTIGAIKNAKLANEIYPDWISRFYIGSDVSTDIIDQIRSYSNTEIIIQTAENNWSGMFWRFDALCDTDIEYVIFRDTDSRLSLREKYAVDDWIASRKTFHIMRDHPFHNFPILGGMWGCKKNTYDLCTILNSWYRGNYYGADYEFLKDKIAPIAATDNITHDSFFEKKPFPKPRIGTEFVGDVFDDQDNRNPNFQKFITDI